MTDAAPASGSFIGQAAPPHTAIEVSGLMKAYGGRLAVDDVSFAVRTGEVFGILGPNGAGKTTTVEILEGYRRSDAGVTRVLDLDPVVDSRALRARIGVMLQTAGLTPGLRPLEQLRLFAAYYDDPEDPVELLRRVGLAESEHTYIRRLSGGQAQRLSLACALVGRPDVLFLDEPTAGMDPSARAATWEIIRVQRSLGRTVVLTTHLMDEAEALCDRLAILSRGRLVTLGTPAELTHQAQSEHVWFSARPDLETPALAAAVGICADAVVETKPGEYTVHASATPELVAALTEWLRTEDVTIGALQANRRSLDEVFLQLTAERDE